MIWALCQYSVIALCVYQVDLHLFNSHVKGLPLPPKQVHDNYCKDLQIRHYFHCAYEQYMNQIIDDLSDCAEGNFYSDSSESLGKGNYSMQGLISVANIDINKEMIPSYPLEK